VKALMKRIAILVPLLAALALGACSAESSLPVATGKASVRAINAIKTSSEVSFSIEERSIGTAAYRQNTSVNRYDDLNYNFNFDAFYAGELSLRRIATMPLDVVKDMDYIFALTGTLADPSIILWEIAERNFAGTETVFEARFAHTAASFGSVDYYFAAPGVDPAAGAAVGTLAFGEVLTAVDIEAGEYVLTITSSGMPDQVLYESATNAFVGATQYIFVSFDGDASTFAPISARAIASGVGSAGVNINMPDANYSPTIEFVNGSMAIGTVDIYEDELLTSQIVAGQAYKGVSNELEFSIGDNTFRYTPTTLLSPVLIDDSVALFGAVRGRTVAFGPLDTADIRSYVPNRQSVETHAKLQLFNSAVSYEVLSIYVVDADATIEDESATRPLFISGTVAATIALSAGSFDIFITEFTEDLILAGPIRIDVDVGDVLGGIVLDTDDPAILELEFLPNNP
jgi:hypothetical protein